MLTVLFIGLIAVATGLLLKFVFDHYGTGFTISWTELAIGGVVCALVIAWPVVHIGTNMARASATTYKEFWSGYEATAPVQTFHCHKYSDDDFGGDDCTHHYRCDPYEVTRTRVVTYTDSNGDTHTRVETYQETHWHHCPVAPWERSFYVMTTLGSGYTFAGHLLPPANPPPSWSAAKARITSGDPGPVTEIHSYSNYILASQKTILKKYSGDVGNYAKAGLMPNVAKDVSPPYAGRKLYVVGAPPGIDAKTWSQAVDYFNAAFGTDLQGDLHFLIVNANKVRDPDDWFGALNANWQSKKQGKHAISKNGVIVAVGTTDGKTIAWARAQTGMPLGNEALLTQIQSDLKGQRLDPMVVLGHPVGIVRQVGGKWKAKVNPGDGILAKDAWGTNRFVRVCMACKSKGDKGLGYGYLNGEIQPSTGAKVAIFFVAFVLCLAVWGAMLAIGPIPVGTPRRTNW